MGEFPTVLQFSFNKKTIVQRKKLYSLSERRLKSIKLRGIVLTDLFVFSFNCCLRGKVISQLAIPIF